MSEVLQKVLFVEDDETHYITFRDLVSSAFPGRFQFEWASTYEAGLEIMLRNEHDAYLLDYFLGNRSGLTLLRTALAKGCRGPFILLTAHGNQEVDLEAMKAGAADYLVKDEATPDVLERSIRYAIERKRSADALLHSQEYARNIVNSSLDMIVAVDNDRRIVEFNRAAEEAFGHAAEAVLGNHVDMLYADPGEGLEVSRLLQEQHACVREVMNVRKSGERFPS